MGTDCLQVVLGFGECSLSLAIGVSQMMFRSHCLGTASVRGMGSSLVGQGFVVCAGTMSEGMEVTTGNLKAAEWSILSHLQMVSHQTAVTTVLARLVRESHTLGESFCLPFDAYY